jgi:hypothetical protein
MAAQVSLSASALQALESGIDAARASLDTDARFRQAVSALGSASSTWGSRFARLSIAPRAASSGGALDLGGLTAQYATLASADPSGFVPALKLAYSQLNQEPEAVEDDSLRWAWLHPRHALRALLLEFAARAGAGSLLVPAIAYRLLIADMTAEQAIPFTVTVMQHQPHYVVRNAIRSQFRKLFPGSVYDLIDALQAAGQSAETDLR